MEETGERNAVTLLWRIENLSHWEPEFHGSGISSPAFTVRTMDGKRWCLFLFPNGRTKEDRHLRLGLRLLAKVIDYSINCECSILDSDGSPLVAGTVRIQSNASITLPVCPTQEEVFVTRKSSFLPQNTLTVRCRIWKSSGELAQAEHFSLVSRIEVQETSFVWPIERFSTLQLGQKVTTPVDLLPFLEQVILSFSLTGTSLLDSGVSFEITAENNSQASLIMFEVSVLDYALKCEQHKHTFRRLDRKQTWIVPNFVSRQELLKKESGCLGSDVLTLLCEFTAVRKNLSEFLERTYCGPSNLNRVIARNVSTFSEVSCQTSHQSGDPPVVSQQRSDSLALLREDFLFLYQEQIFSDFELSSEDVSFPVHKSVLSARSPVFRAMFSSDMKESNSNFLDVPDLDAHTLNRMLTFLYTGTVQHMQWEGAAKLYYAADKYQVSSLKQLCTSTLRSDITMSNVCDILVLADRHQDQELASFVHDFILNHYDEILLSDEWGTFLGTDAYLAGITMRHVYKRKQQVTK